MSVLPSVRAELAERFIFNYRIPPDALKKYLPAPWLVPQPVRGYAVISFCILDLRHITVAPLPTVAGLHSISCAPRIAVLDTRDADAPPKVFVTERQTNSAFGHWFTTLGFSAPHPFVEAAIRHMPDDMRLDVGGAEQGAEFAAVVQADSRAASELFADAEDFAAFIRRGVTSYGQSRHEGQLTVVDLHKDDATYEPLRVCSIGGTVVEGWQADGAILDSAFRTSGGRYEWTYHGLVSREAAGR